MSIEIKGLILAILSAVCYGTLPYFGLQLTMQGLSNEAMLFWRFTTAFILMACCFPKSVFILKTVNWGKLLLSIAGFVVSAFFFFESTTYIGTGLTMTVFFIYPIILALFNFIFLKEKPPLLQKVGMFLALVAMIFLSNFEFHYQGDVFWGFLFAIIGALGYAVFVFLTRATGLPTITLTSWVCFGAALFFAGHSYYNNSMQSLPYGSFIYLPTLAIVCTLLPIIFFIRAVSLIGNVKASLLSITEPATTICIGILLLNEQITALQGIGLLFMLASIITIEGKSLFSR